MLDSRLCVSPPCRSWKTVTHYFHSKDGEPHNFEIPNPQPPSGTMVATPRPQPCPIDGCPMSAEQPMANPTFTYCLNCGNVEQHQQSAP
ncbi:MAG TPA: hypothetical protein VMH22_03325 [bacterium]|nr:hypothetical protein [bacterium]